MQEKKILIIISIVALLLLIPLIAMQFTDEVNWTLGDFLVAGCLLFGTGLLIDWVIRAVNNSAYRIIIYVVIVAILLLVWAELAVGILGTPFAGD